jgi:hypothetical protein
MFIIINYIIIQTFLQITIIPIIIIITIITNAPLPTATPITAFLFSHHFFFIDYFNVIFPVKNFPSF